MLVVSNEILPWLYFWHFVYLLMELSAFILPFLYPVDIVFFRFIMSFYSGLCVCGIIAYREQMI